MLMLTFLKCLLILVNLLLSSNVESLRTVVKYLEDCTEVAIHENKDRYCFFSTKTLSTKNFPVYELLI